MMQGISVGIAKKKKLRFFKIYKCALRLLYHDETEI